MEDELTDEQIRDWFAGQALIGILSVVSDRAVDTKDTVSRTCFNIADAMMAERKRRQPTEQEGNPS